MYKLTFTIEASRQLAELAEDKGLHRQCKAVKKALAQLEASPSHPGLRVHPFKGEACMHRKTLLEAYAQNRTPGAYRIFFCFCAGNQTITIAAITPHP